MKKAYLSIALLITGVLLAALSACNMNCVRGSGHVVSETRKVTDFTRIEISGNFKIILKQDSSLALNIKADDNLLKYIKTNIEGGTLHIKTKKNVCEQGDLTITIGVHNLEELKSSGAIELTSDGKLTTKDLDLGFSGAAKATLDLNAAKVTTTGSGATEITLTGQASSHSINVSGVGKIYALDFVVGDYDIETSGASECSINVLHSLNVHTSGAASIKYRGNPSSIHNEKSGASSLDKVN